MSEAIDAICSSVFDPMAQDEIPEQDIVVEEQELPQMDPEAEMGAAAAAAYDTSPPPPRQNPPILLERSAVDVILQAMKANANEMERKMDGMAQTVREEMQCMGAGLQNGLDKVRGDRNS